MASEPKELEIGLHHKDFFRQTLGFPWPFKLDASELRAVVHVTQPYGFHQTLTGDVHCSRSRGTVEIEYPLVDDGRFLASGNKGPWGMGRYLFEVDLYHGDSVLASGSVELDPNTSFGETHGKKLAQADSMRQFIECAPVSPAFISSKEAKFSIRTIPGRVRTCTVEVDVLKPGVLKPECGTPCAGPVRMDLTEERQCVSFDSNEWARGEYWLRTRVLVDSRPIGPYLVRQFWKETSSELRKPELPLRPENKAQYLVDGWTFACSKGLVHKPDQLERLSAGPVLRIDRPWEEGTERLSVESLVWDAEDGMYRITYSAGPISLDPDVRKRCEAELYQGTRYLCLAVSPDGICWEKPNLGYVEFEGSRENNILRDMRDEQHLFSGEYDSFPVRVKGRPIPQRYRYRFYDAETDGPVDMDRFVFRQFQDFNREDECQFEGGFRPRPWEFWGFERRGDLFLALTRKPVLVEKQGFDLHATNERASSYPFEGEKTALFSNNGRGSSIFYDRKSKTFYYFFRPNYPPYPPNGMPYYVTHRPSQIRTRAVMWTRDGINWDRRHMLVPDERDVPGTTLYGFGFIRPAERSEIDTDGQLCLGTLKHWDLRTMVSRFELVWSRDHIHWHRFGANRKALLSGGPVRNHDASIETMSEYYSMTGTDGEEEWWFPYEASNHRYMLGGLVDPFDRQGAGISSLAEFKAKNPHMQLAPFFTSWEDFYKEAESAATLPALARCTAGRLAHVEPEEAKGEFTTHPLVVQGAGLEVNAKTQSGGRILAEIQDVSRKAVAGFGLTECIPFSGDRVRGRIKWRRARLEELHSRVVRLRFVVESARLYTFRIAQ